MALNCARCAGSSTFLFFSFLFFSFPPLFRRPPFSRRPSFSHPPHRLSSTRRPHLSFHFTIFIFLLLLLLLLLLWWWWWWWWWFIYLLFWFFCDVGIFFFASPSFQPAIFVVVIKFFSKVFLSVFLFLSQFVFRALMGCLQCNPGVFGRTFSQYFPPLNHFCFSLFLSIWFLSRHFTDVCVSSPLSSFSSSSSSSSFFSSRVPQVYANWVPSCPFLRFVLALIQTSAGAEHLECPVSSTWKLSLYFAS